MAFINRISPYRIRIIQVIQFPVVADFSSPERSPERAIVLPPASALALASASALAAVSALAKCSRFTLKFLRSHSFYTLWLI